MEYNILPFGEIWQGGIFNVPSALAEKYIRLTSENQLKALLLILANSGVCSSEEIAKRLGIAEADAEEIMEFWVSEGVAAVNSKAQSKAPSAAEKPAVKESAPAIAEGKKLPKEKKSVRVCAPTLTPADIVRAVNENPEIGELLNDAQVVLGRTISHAEGEMLVNLVNFYGFKAEIILMILDYCKQEKQRNKDKKIGTAYIMRIAENWLDEGIDSLSLAEEKLRSIESSDRYWNEITALAGIKHRNPTQKQRDMVLSWYADFSLEMITIAIDKMRENTQSPKLSYVDSIIKSWRKNGIKTPEDVKRENEAFAKKREAEKEKKAPGKIGRKPTYDLEQIKKDAMKNTEIKF